MIKVGAKWKKRIVGIVYTGGESLMPLFTIDSHTFYCTPSIYDSTWLKWGNPMSEIRLVIWQEHPPPLSLQTCNDFLYSGPQTHIKEPELILMILPWKIKVEPHSNAKSTSPEWNSTNEDYDIQLGEATIEREGTSDWAIENVLLHFRVTAVCTILGKHVSRLLSPTS